jgi:hypothetical protein
MGCRPWATPCPPRTYYSASGAPPRRRWSPPQLRSPTIFRLWLNGVTVAISVAFRSRLSHVRGTVSASQFYGCACETAIPYWAGWALAAPHTRRGRGLRIYADGGASGTISLGLIHQGMHVLIAGLLIFPGIEFNYLFAPAPALSSCRSCFSTTCFPALQRIVERMTSAFAGAGLRSPSCSRRSSSGVRKRRARGYYRADSSVPLLVRPACRLATR